MRKIEDHSDKMNRTKVHTLTHLLDVTLSLSPLSLYDDIDRTSSERSSVTSAVRNTASRSTEAHVHSSTENS